MALSDDVAEALRGCSKRADQVAAVVKLIETMERQPVVIPTGVPGAIAGEEDIAPGVTVRRNGNGSVIEVELQV